MYENPDMKMAATTLGEKVGRTIIYVGPAFIGCAAAIVEHAYGHESAMIWAAVSGAAASVYNQIAIPKGGDLGKAWRQAAVSGSIATAVSVSSLVAFWQADADNVKAAAAHQAAVQVCEKAGKVMISISDPVAPDARKFDACILPKDIAPIP